MTGLVLEAANEWGDEFRRIGLFLLNERDYFSGTWEDYEEFPSLFDRNGCGYTTYWKRDPRSRWETLINTVTIV